MGDGVDGSVELFSELLDFVSDMLVVVGDGVHGVVGRML